MSLCRYMIRTCRMKQDHSRWSATWRVGTLQLGPVLSRRGNSPTDLDDSMDVPTMAIHRRFLDPFDDHLTHSHIEIQRGNQLTSFQGFQGFQGLKKKSRASKASKAQTWRICWKGQT